MNLSDTEKLVFANYLANGAQELNMVGRFWPYGELTMVIEDKVRVAARKFGLKAASACGPVAKAYLDLLIERGAFSTTQNKFGGSMHQFQPDVYAKVLKDLQATDPTYLKAQAEGPAFWDAAFGA
jgi:hypothetical protein